MNIEGVLVADAVEFPSENVALPVVEASLEVKESIVVEDMLWSVVFVEFAAVNESVVEPVDTVRMPGLWDEVME